MADGNKIPKRAAMAPVRPYNLYPTKAVDVIAIGPGNAWHILIISMNSSSEINFSFSTNSLSVIPIMA